MSGLILSLMLLSLFGCAVKGENEREAFACLFSHNLSQQNSELSCSDDEGIELSRVLVGQSSSYSCTSEHCDLEEIADENNMYYKYLTSICHHYSGCILSSSTLSNLSNNDIFSSCGWTHKVRNTVRVYYRCVDVGGTPLTQSTTESPTITSTTTAPALPETASSSNAAVQVWPTETAQITGQNNVENLMVKIVAPILGFLTLVSLVVLIVCLRAKKLGPPSRIREKPATVQPANYEDVADTYPADEEVYYSELRQQRNNSFTNPTSILPTTHVESSDTKSESHKSNHVYPPERLNAIQVVMERSQVQTKHRVENEVSRNESMTDDGFYDSVSDDNVYSLAEPVLSDTYAEIRREMSHKHKKTTPVYQQKDNQSANQSTADNKPRGGCRREKRFNSKDLYSVAEPVCKEIAMVLSEEPVLIKNDLYEQTDIRFPQQEVKGEKDRDKEVIQGMENALYVNCTIDRISDS